ncbi:hypothetical protein H257_17269 [Aphanomyces astaci]|uniref:CCHC-type domain-containing protein n=1 Tax=Aphanomyces astaci TaxID=112090 RepID=W4FFD6_APHAT|nr:hypothetical protein H257_17269 [Aphanomyces astaci]ETV66227.1 hypothetical protein H257_17269 [Aphanomyces astaci]|eukprot:XP_009844296.1 hypothetical protein H257_17269 [Aphanomyces astaci]
MRIKEIIPEAKNSDARNAIQEITNLLIHRNDQIEELIEDVLERKIQVYQKARKMKAKARPGTKNGFRAVSFQAPSLNYKKSCESKFEPDNLQDRPRDQLYELKQAQCASLTEYVAKLRRICTQVCEFAERDKVSWFQRGLQTRTCEELQYRRCETVTLAIQVALNYERSHNSILNGFQDLRHPFNNRLQGNRPPNAYPPSQHQDDDMEVDNAQVQHRGQRQVDPCYNCGRMGHRISDCRSQPRNNQGRSQAQPQRNNISRHANRPQRPQRNTPSRQHNAQVTEVNSDTEDSEDDVEEVILGNNMGLAQQDSAEESLNINTAQQAVPAQENKLMIVHGALDNTSVRILIDSIASNLLCRPGLAKTVIRSEEVQAEGLDGHCSGIKKVKEISDTLCFGQWTFLDLILTEWDLGKKDFDVIVGKPLLFYFNPVIDWPAVCVRVAATLTRHANDKFNVLTATNVDFDIMLGKTQYEQCFQANLRCSQSTFRCLASWLSTLHPELMRRETSHWFKKKVAVQLYFLWSEGGYRETGAAFGMSKSWSVETVNVFVAALAKQAK